MVGVPHWLSSKSIDELIGPDLDEYKVLYDSFVGILREEETTNERNHAFSERLMEDWRSGKMWYNAALKSSNGFPIIFEQNLQPRYFPSFEPDAEGVTLMRLWGEDWEEFIAGKLKDKATYIERVRAIFAKAEAEAAALEKEKRPTIDSEIVL
jgi:DNA-binding ferritin-like protein (Dps family)